MWFWSLGGEDHVEKEMAAHSHILTWEIPWTEGGYSLYGHRIEYNLELIEYNLTTKQLNN